MEAQKILEELLKAVSKKDFLREHLYISLRNKERCNGEITRPNKYLENINDVMSVELSTSSGILGRLEAKKTLLQKAGMSVEEAWEIARANTINKEAINPYAECGNMTVITSKSKYDGAGTIYATEKLKQFANGSRLLIIPRSIHELIAMRYEVGMDIIKLNEIIRNTNKTGCENNEVLSDRAYVIDF